MPSLALPRWLLLWPSIAAPAPAREPSAAEVPVKLRQDIGLPTDTAVPTDAAAFNALLQIKGWL